MSLNSEREDKAIEALISGALHPFSAEVSDKDISNFLESGCVLSPEGKAALERLGENPLAGISHQPEVAAVPDLIEEFTAMHRELAADEIDEEIQVELARKREEILKRIREKRDPRE